MPLGTSEDYDEGDTGGSPYIQAHKHGYTGGALPAHTHTITAHTLSGTVGPFFTGGQSNQSSGNLKTTKSSNRQYTAKDASTNSWQNLTAQGSLSHSVTATGSATTTGTVNGVSDLPAGQTTGDQGNMPPYLVINYIIATGRFE